MRDLRLSHSDSVASFPLLLLDRSAKESSCWVIRVLKQSCGSGVHGNEARAHIYTQDQREVYEAPWICLPATATLWMIATLTFFFSSFLIQDILPVASPPSTPPSPEVSRTSAK